MTEPLDALVERVCVAMCRASRAVDPYGVTPSPRGQAGMMPTWKLYEHMARAAIEATELKAMQAEIGRLRATIERVRLAIEWVEPIDEGTRNAMRADLRGGLSLRKCAEKYGVGVGVVRGLANPSPEQGEELTVSR